jgi:gluconate 2-dehydrogenase gamma chain
VDVETAAALADAIFPADHDVRSASELGAVDYLVRRLAGPWGRGEDRYLSPPFVEPQHGGHGGQSSAAPVDVVNHALRELRRTAEVRFGASFAGLPPRDRDTLVAELADGTLPGTAGDDAFALIRDLVLEGVLADPRHGGNRGGAAWAWLGYSPAQARDEHRRTA